MHCRVRAVALVAALWGFALVAVSAQETPAVARVSGDFVPLPELRGHRFTPNDYMIFGAWFDADHAELVRTLRRVPWAKPGLTRMNLLVRKHLHRPAVGFRDGLVYFESTWLSPERLRMIASIVRHADRMLLKHLGSTRWNPVQIVYLVDKDEYLLMVDRMAKDEKTKRLARLLSSKFVGDHRLSHDDQSFKKAASLAIGDTVGRRGPQALWSFKGMKEGLHTYLSAFMTLYYAQFVSVEATTPDGRNRNSVELLFRTARAYFEANKTPLLRQVLCSELNAITFDRLAVSFAFWDYLFRYERDRLSRFIDRLTYHHGRDWKPMGPWSAFRESVERSFGYPVETLETKVRTLAAKDYVLDDERIRRLLQVEKTCGKRVMRTCRKAEKRLAANKSLSVGERMAWRRVMEVTDELLAGSEVTL